MTRLWSIEGEALTTIRPEALDSERQLHRWLANDIGLLDSSLMVIGSEVPTAHGGRIDLLAIDAEGALSIIELKRDRTPREVIAQALDYASWVVGLDTPAIHRIADAYMRDRTTFAEEFERRFGMVPPETAQRKS